MYNFKISISIIYFLKKNWKYRRSEQEKHSKHFLGGIYMHANFRFRAIRFLLNNNNNKVAG